MEAIRLHFSTIKNITTEKPKKEKQPKQPKQPNIQSQPTEKYNQRIKNLEDENIALKKACAEIPNLIKLAVAQASQEIKKEYNSKIGILEEKQGQLTRELALIMSDACPVIYDGPQPENPSKYILYHSCERKDKYDSERKARDAAEFYSNIYGNNSRVYKCRYCGKWHLTTKAKAE